MRRLEMADKMHTLIVGGQEVQVPAWASESTMGQVASYMAQQAKTDTMFAKMMKGIGGDTASLQAAIQSLVGATNRDIKADDASDTEQEKFTKKLVRGSSKLDKAMGFFGNHEKPLSAMTDGLSSLAKGAKSAGGGFKFLEKLTKSTGGLAQGAGAALNVAADAFLAYAGWNAAKLEQFANVQSKMIDSGILFEGGAAAYDELRKGIQNTGNTYLHLSETLGTFSDGMLGLGDSVTTGAMEFSKFYQALNTTAETLGDLGMSSKDMMTAYGEYISYSRRTGQLNKRLNRSAEDVNSTFINMQIEAGAVANLTSLTRSEAMRASMESMDTLGSAANRVLIDKGMINQANLQTDVMQSLGKVAGSSESLQTILTAYNLAAYRNTGDPSEFDMSAIIQNMTPGLEAQMNTLVPGMIDSIEEFTKTGTAPAEGMMSWIVTQINNADQTKLAASGVAGDTFATSLLKMQAEFQMISLNFGNLADGDKLKTAIESQRKDIAEAGKTTQAMNEMTEKFIHVQEALTLDMENTAMLFDGLKTSLAGGKAMLDKILVLAGFGDELNDFGGAGGNKEQLAAAIAGVMPDVSNNEIMTPAVAGEEGEVNVIEDTSTAGKAILAMRANEGMVTKEMFETLGIEQVHDVEVAVEYLNSLLPGFREKAMTLIATYNDEMKGTKTRLAIFGGKTTKVDPDDPDNYANSGAAINFAIMQDGKLVKKQADVMNENTSFGRAVEAAGLYQGHNVDGQDTPGKNAGQVTSNYGKFEKADHRLLRNDTDINEETVAGSSHNEGVQVEDADGEIIAQHDPGIHRKDGGPVVKDQPYIVGDQLGMKTAELFIPDTSGNIVNNTDLNDAIERMRDAKDSLLPGAKQRKEYANTKKSAAQPNEDDNLTEAMTPADFVKHITAQAKALGAVNANLEGVEQRTSKFTAEEQVSFVNTMKDLQGNYAEVFERLSEEDQNDRDMNIQRIESMRASIKEAFDQIRASNTTRDLNESMNAKVAVNNQRKIIDEAVSQGIERHAPIVGPSNDMSQVQTNIKNIQNRLTNIEQSVTMNNSQDLSELAASKRSAIETVKILQSIVKRYNIGEKSKTVTNIMNSR